MGLVATDKSGRDRSVDLNELSNAEMGTVSGGLLNMDPQTHTPRLVPKTKADWAVQAATLPLFLYGGPEAKAGAGFLERAGSRALRAGVTGAETVASDLVRGLANKAQGQPSGLTANDEATRFATGAGVGLGGSLLGGALRSLSGLTGAEKEAGHLATQRGEVYSKAAAEARAVKGLRATMGASAPGLSPDAVNQNTRDAQNAVGHSIGSIHQGINNQYKTLFAPYENNPIEQETFTAPIKDFQTELENSGRERQLGGAARKLLNDAVNVGTEEVPVSALNVSDPAVARRVLQGAGVSVGDIAGMDKYELGKIIQKASDYTQLGARRIPVAKPMTVQAALTFQSRANGILTSRAASANDKAAASAVSRAAQGALDSLGDQGFLSDAEKQQHAALKQQTRSFYTDLGDVFVGKAKTPAEVGQAVFSQPAHVVSRIVDAATPQEKQSLQRAFADWAIPEDAEIGKVVPKLAELDQSGVLKKIIPGRYGKIEDWASTFRSQERLKQMAGTPAGAAEIAAGEQAASQTPEGRRFLDRYKKELGSLPPNERAALDAAMAQGAKGGMMKAAGGHGFMLRYAGLIAPIEMGLGFGLWKGNPVGAAVAFTAFVGTAGWKAAMRNDASRAKFLDAIEDPNIRRQSYRLARLAMGLGITEMKSQPEEAAGSRFDNYKGRFDFEASSKDGKTFVENPTEGGQYVDPKTALPWVDIPRNTQRGDVRALYSGKSGTSEGDAWDPRTVQYVEGLKAKGLTVDQAVDALKQYFITNRIPHFMSTHPGKKAYFEK